MYDLLSAVFVNYPENWSEIKKGIYELYGGKYCLKISPFHKGRVYLHHYVPLSLAEYKAEEYFLNEPWNLVPLCAYHHSKMHGRHIGDLTEKYEPKRWGKPKVSWLRRFFWYIKRHYYHHRFEKRHVLGENYKILFFWNYTKWGTKRRKRKMEKSLEDLLR